MDHIEMLRRIANVDKTEDRIRAAAAEELDLSVMVANTGGTFQSNNVW